MKPVEALRKPGWQIAACAAVLLLLNIWLNAPIFQNGAQPYRGSIESGYAGIARFFAEHPNPGGWNPFIYCGISTQHTYLPGMPYVTAMLMWISPKLEGLHAYRIITGLFACLGPVTLFLFGAYASGSRWWPFAAAIGYSLCSPAYDLFQTIDNDRGLLPVPWRLHVMLKYGEGPHNMGLTLVPLAMLAVWAAAKSRGFPRLFAAAIALAAVALTHWIAALALAIACLLLFLTHFAVRAAEPFGHLRVVFAGVLAYALACFWLTPTFIRTVAFNWPKDAFGYKLQQKQHAAMVLLAVAIFLIWWLFRRYPAHRYLCFVTLCFFFFAALAEGHYAHQVDILPESRRYTLEMEMFLALALAEWMRTGWRAGGGVNRFCVGMVVGLLAISGLPQAVRFIRHGYDEWKLRPKEYTVEYRIAEWLQRQSPTGRVYVSGGLRFALNSWLDIAQTNGTFDSGLLNRSPLDFDYRFRTLSQMRPGLEARDSRLILQAMGVEYLVVHGEGSEEYYRDVKMPARFEEIFPLAYESGPDRVYKVPFHGLAYFRRHDEAPASWEPVHLETYLPHALERGPALALDWTGPSHLRIRGGIVPQDSGIAVTVSHAPGWTATQNGERIPVTRDATGFLYLRPKPGTSANIDLRYGPTLEHGFFSGLSAATWLASLAFWLRKRAPAREPAEPVRHLSF